MKVLGLDVSSISTGYSILDNGVLLKDTCGLIEPNPRRPYGERLQTFEISVKDLIKNNNPDLVVIEDIFKGRNAKTFKSLAMFRGVAIKAIFDMIGQDPISIMASEARKTVGVKNDKEEAFKFITNKFDLDYEFEKHNDIADSILLALACYTMETKKTDDEPVRSIGRTKKRKRKRNKKRLQKVSPTISPR